jgi:CRP-like cAMP-binding protein
VMTLLFRGVYEFAVENGYLFLMSAVKPFLFPYFASMGFRPYERAYISSAGGFRIPIALVNHDQDYLRACKSLFASASNFGREAPGAAAAMEWFEKCCPKDDALNVRVLTRPEHVDFDVGFMKGLSEATIRSIFRNAVVIRCERGDQLIKQNAADQVIGFIVEGSVDVKKGDRTIATLRAGEIFGEVSFLLKVPRTASLYAAEEGTRIVYISMHSVDAIKDPLEASVFWRSLSVHLATRLQHTTELL